MASELLTTVIELMKHIEAHGHSSSASGGVGETPTDTKLSGYSKKNYVLTELQKRFTIPQNEIDIIRCVIDMIILVDKGLITISEFRKKSADININKRFRNDCCFTC